jgi:hypothetical protein
MLFSALVTAALTAALGAVSSFHWALALRALTGFCDGVMSRARQRRRSRTRVAGTSRRLDRMERNKAFEKFASRPFASAPSSSRLRGEHLEGLHGVPQLVPLFYAYRAEPGKTVPW